jgi:hypothetical protein
MSRLQFRVSPASEPLQRQAVRLATTVEENAVAKPEGLPPYNEGLDEQGDVDDVASQDYSDDDEDIPTQQDGRRGTALGHHG